MTSAKPGPIVPKIQAKKIALPTEHGSWGFLFEPIVAKLMSPHDLACDLTQDDLSLGHPGLDMDEPMIPSRENRAQPDRRHATKGQTLPVAMGRKMGVKQRR